MLNLIQEKLNTAFPNQIQYEQGIDMISIVVPSNKIHDIVSYLYNDEALQYRFLTDVTGIHFPDNVGQELGVVYHLHALVPNNRIRIKTFLNISAPEIDSIYDIFNGANWMERETYDFYGIIFKNHPDLRRILNVDEMDYFPMRKEYPMEDPTRLDKDDDMFGRGNNY